MSQIEQLIAELCPDGVEYKPLGEFLDYEQPTKYLVATKDYDDSYPTPVLTAGQTFILGYTAETNGIYEASPDKPVIIFDDFTTAFQWVDFPFKAKSSAMKMLSLKDSQGSPVQLRYLYFAMQCLPYAVEGHKRHWIASYSKLEIPVPPVAVQEEIVRILDTFSQLEAELEAELEARRKQYAFYRDQLLTFATDVRHAPLSELCVRISSGGTPDTKQPRYYGGDIPWLRTQEVDFGEISSTGMTITEEGLANSSAHWMPANTVVVAMYGATVGKCAYTSIPLTTNQACCNLELDSSVASYKYVFHWLSSKYEFIKSLGQGSQTNINARVVKNLVVPVPSLEVQQRIVEVLDNFEAICADLNIGLPAELEARRKQYEYYRDRLLAFPRA